MRTHPQRIRAAMLATAVLTLSLITSTAAQDDVAAAGLEGLLPMEVGGIPTQVQVFGLDTLLGMIDPEDDDLAETIAALEGLPETLGVPADGIFFGVAQAADMEAGRGTNTLILAVPGADGETLREPLNALVGVVDSTESTRRSMLGEPAIADVEVAGKDVWVLEVEVLADGEYDLDDSGESIVYAADHAAFFIRGTSAEVLELLGALP